MNGYFSIDLGTTGLKSSLMNENGDLIISRGQEYEIVSKKSGWAEQDPYAWWKALKNTVSSIRSKNPDLLKNIKAVSICGQMHTHVYLDKNKNPLRTALTWLDQRASGIVERWKAEGLDDEIEKLTLNFPSTTYTAPQIIWIKENEKETFEKTDKILLAKDYIKFLLTGEMTTDPSDASGTMLYDVKNNVWCDKLFDIFNIPRNLFPEVKKSTEVMGFVSKKASEYLGIPAGIPVVNGGSDHSVSEVGSGLLREGNASVIIGTAGVLASVSNEPKRDNKNRIICWSYPIEGMWDFLAITQTAASCLTWFKNTFDKDAGSDIYENYTKIASEIIPGSENLIFLPYIMGERTPHWDPYARGVFFGMGINHNKGHFVRSIMEGVVYSIRECLDILRELGLKIDKIISMGGGSKSDIWCQIQADNFKKEVYTLKCGESGAMGNLILSLFALEEISSIEEAEKLIKIDKKYKCDEKNDIVYMEGFNKYKELYRSLKKFMKNS